LNATSLPSDIPVADLAYWISKRSKGWGLLTTDGKPKDIVDCFNAAISPSGPRIGD
jgi:hypothetical protein